MKSFLLIRLGLASVRFGRLAVKLSAFYDFTLIMARFDSGDRLLGFGSAPNREGWKQRAAAPSENPPVGESSLNGQERHEKWLGGAWKLPLHPRQLRINLRIKTGPGERFIAIRD